MGNEDDGGSVRAREDEALPPSPAALRGLRPRSDLAWLHVSLSAMLIAGGVWLSAGTGNVAVYALAQLGLGLGFCQTFVLLHEAGHRTLFRRRALNETFGYLAGFLSLIPYSSWRPVHARHHRYTGWQDLDATTASLVPRPLSHWEKRLIDAAWRSWLPLFSVLYRIQNYWRIGRVRGFPGMPIRPLLATLVATLHFLAYCLLAGWWGIAESFRLLGPGLLLALMAQDVLLLSQHTHMPTHLSLGRAVRLFPPMEQASFTRSLRLPAWLSWLLMHFDAHELHHMYPAVPGYLLRRIPYSPSNEVNWIEWLREVKGMSGSEFLFGGNHGPGVAS